MPNPRMASGFQAAFHHLEGCDRCRYSALRRIAGDLSHRFANIPYALEDPLFGPVLRANARIGIAELASQLGVSRNTAQHRIRRLEEAEVLTGFRPIINLSAVGMPVQALISIDLDQRRMLEVIHGLEGVPEVLEAKVQAGREDLLVQVAPASLGALQVLTASIVGIEGVRKTTSTFSVGTPIPYRLQPLLDRVPEDAGWARSTPAPTT
jgi:DNA-binding Lrp family transcriptional regulator